MSSTWKDDVLTTGRKGPKSHSSYTSAPRIEVLRFLSIRNSRIPSMWFQSFSLPLLSVEPILTFSSVRSRSWVHLSVAFFFFIWYAWPLEEVNFLNSLGRLSRKQGFFSSPFSLCSSLIALKSLPVSQSFLLLQGNGFAFSFSFCLRIYWWSRKALSLPTEEIPVLSISWVK